MTRILLLGLDPETVNFSDPALPPGMTAEKVRAGIAAAVKQFTDRGWESDVGSIRPDETAGPAVEGLLRSTNSFWPSSTFPKLSHERFISFFITHGAQTKVFHLPAAV